MRINAASLAGVFLLSGFALVILGDELESHRVSVINECLGRYFKAKADKGNEAAQALLDACRAQHGLDNRFRWDNTALHLLAFPACKYRNGWSSSCFRIAAN